MAQQVIFYDSFTGPTGAHILDHAPEIGDWISGLAYTRLGLDGGGRLGSVMPNIGGTYCFFVDSANLSVSAPTILEFAVSADGSGFALWGDIDGNWATGVQEASGQLNFSHNGVNQSVTLSAARPRKISIRIGATDAKLLVDESVVATITSASNMSSVARAALSVELPPNPGDSKLDYAVILADPDGTWTPPPDPVIALEAIASAPSPLHTVQVLGGIGVGSWSSAPSMLGAASALVNHDFTVALGDVTARYLMDLVTPSGLVRAPISSWQATLQTGGKCYVQAVVPASTQYADAINAASEFVISRAAVLPSGMQVEQEMARAPVSAQFDRGSMRETCTISGYADAFAASENPSSEYDRTLSRIRSMSSGAGGMRVRCAVDWLLRPGQRAYANGVPMIADYINYYAPTGGDSYMDVGERA